MSASLLLLHMIGAVALLLWGMRMVRTGVSRAFGADLRQAIGRAVGNRARALATGVVVTGILQSSTATALMVASFASRGLIATAPALAVMLGADIGTTLVAQVLSFEVGWLSPLLIAAGVVAHYTTERTLPRQLGRAAIGLGLMLLSLGLIVATSEPLRGSTVLHEMFEALGGERVIGVLIALLLTWLAHSSLAIVLLVMSLAAAGVTSMPLAFALIIGANLGGTLAPLVATWTEGPTARRVTLGNIFFKVAGGLAMLPLIDLVQPLIAVLDADPARQAVNFHTAFNVVIAAVFIFATGPVGALAQRLLPATPDAGDVGVPRHLDRASMGSPMVALASAARETLRMGDLVETMLNRGLAALERDDDRAAAEVRAMDDAVDRLHGEIKLYVSAVSRNEMDDAESRRAAEILAFTTNLEHIGDIIENVMDLIAKKVRRKMQFSPEGLADIRRLHRRVADNLKLALGMFISGDVKLARQLLAEKREVNAMERASSEAHLARLVEGRPESIETSALHLDILRDLKRIHSHVVAGAYPILDAAGELPHSRPAPRAPGEKG